MHACIFVFMCARVCRAVCVGMDSVLVLICMPYLAILFSCPSCLLNPSRAYVLIWAHIYQISPTHTHTPQPWCVLDCDSSCTCLCICTWKRWRGVPDRPPILARRVRLAYLHTNTSSHSCVCVLICIRMHATDGGMHRLATHTRHTSGCAGNEPASAA